MSPSDYNEEEDELWSSDDDPDWLPEGGSEEDSHGDDEDELWSSDDDPDWVPEDHSNEDSSDEASQTSDKGKIGNLDQDLIQELAEAMLVSSGGRGTLEDMVGLVVSLELTREEALDALDGLYKMIAEQEQGREQGKEAHPNDVDQTRPEIPRPSPESESFSKRPLRQYKGQYSQQQQDEYRQADQLDLARGVEPLSPGSQGRVDVGDGVEPWRRRTTTATPSATGSGRAGGGLRTRLTLSPPPTLTYPSPLYPRLNLPSPPPLFLPLTPTLPRLTPLPPPYSHLPLTPTLPKIKLLSPTPHSPHPSPPLYPRLTPLPPPYSHLPLTPTLPKINSSPPPTLPHPHPHSTQDPPPYSPLPLTPTRLTPLPHPPTLPHPSPPLYPRLTPLPPPLLSLTPTLPKINSSPPPPHTPT
ncbi:hypothetical protein C7M84_001777 [Penaeus vannamei]|uniref:Uncharacterized protein n=1 Tax=Penaeus vannamei TaxID=6689 RepID=A0A3R7PQK0_PENVA|nr:hypothetical protein C7M84_001777 [Penaeus vannamei]